MSEALAVGLGIKVSSPTDFLIELSLLKYLTNESVVRELCVSREAKPFLSKISKE